MKAFLVNDNGEDIWLVLADNEEQAIESVGDDQGDFLTAQELPAATTTPQKIFSLT